VAGVFLHVLGGGWVLGGCATPPGGGQRGMAMLSVAQGCELAERSFGAGAALSGVDDELLVELGVRGEGVPVGRDLAAEVVVGSCAASLDGDVGSGPPLAGEVFDLELQLDEAAAGCQAMDERRAIKVLRTSHCLLMSEADITRP
jgi:hypothetical protein